MSPSDPHDSPRETPTDLTRYDLVDVDYENGSYAKLLKRIPVGSEVLELGPWTGRTTQALRERGCRVVGVERDVDAAAAASGFCDRIIVADLDTFDPAMHLDGDSFDVILAADVLEHLRDPEDLLRRMRPHLRPAGRLLVSLPNVAHGSVRLALLEGRFPYADSGLLDRTHLKFFTEDTARSMLEQSGFVIDEVDRGTRGVTGTEIDFNPSTLTDEISRLIEADPNCETYQFVIAAEPAPNHTESGTPATSTGAAPQHDSPLTTAQARHIETLRTLVDDQRKTIEELKQQAARELEQRAATATADKLQAEWDLQQLTGQLENMQASKAWRFAKAVRTVTRRRG